MKPEQVDIDSYAVYANDRMEISWLTGKVVFLHDRRPPRGELACVCAIARQHGDIIRIELITRRELARILPGYEGSRLAIRARELASVRLSRNLMGGAIPTSA